MLQKTLCNNRIAICAVKSEYVYTERENKAKSQTEVHTMKEIRTFEKAIENKVKSLKEEGINRTLFWAYRTSKEESENDLIDFNEVIWDYDIKEIADTLRAEGIKEFTISSTFSSLIETLAEFEKHGIYMNGLTTVNARYTDWNTGKHARIPAIKMEVR